MKTSTLITPIVALAVCWSQAQAAEEKTIGEKTGEVIDKTVDKTKEISRKAVEKTKEAGRAVAEGTKKAVAKTKDAVAPDPDARKVEVTLSEHRIEMPASLPPGKTAFIVRNTGAEDHSFEIAGEGIDKKFFASVSPEQTKTLQVDLQPGTYKVTCPRKGHEAKGMELSLLVK